VAPPPLIVAHATSGWFQQLACRHFLYELGKCLRSNVVEDTAFGNHKENGSHTATEDTICLSCSFHFFPRFISSIGRTLNSAQVRRALFPQNIIPLSCPCGSPSIHLKHLVGTTALLPTSAYRIDDVCWSPTELQFGYAEVFIPFLVLGRGGRAYIVVGDSNENYTDGRCRRCTPRENRHGRSFVDSPEISLFAF